MFTTKKECERRVSKAVHDTITQFNKTWKDSKVDLKRYEANSYLNKFIIGVSNENEPMFIGKVMDIDYDALPSIIPVIHDRVRDQKFYFMGSFKLYTEQLARALLKLTIEERAAVMFNELYKGKEVIFTNRSYNTSLKESDVDYEGIIQVVNKEIESDLKK